ncbi:MAG: bacteriohemerythrin [Melioribacteraceae bacterium]|nr:bacteriohemerythrin [Melioribacteraceae bacterium]
MQKIEWTEKLNLDIEDIDQQHMKFLEIVNDLLAAISEKRSKQVLSKIIDELISYAFYHFSKEERYFNKANYPDASQHEKEHEAFIDKVTKFQKDFNENKITLSIDMINFMSNWWINHIKISDRKYLPYVQKISL